LKEEKGPQSGWKQKRGEIPSGAKGDEGKPKKYSSLHESGNDFYFQGRSKIKEKRGGGDDGA